MRLIIPEQYAMEVLPNLTAPHDIHGYEYDEDEYYNGITGELDHFQHGSLQTVVNTATDPIISSSTTTTTDSPLLSTFSSDILLQCRQTQPMGMDYDEPTSTTKKIFEIFCDNTFINNFIDKGTTNVIHSNNNESVSGSHINNYKSNNDNYLFESIVRRISRYKCDLINTHYSYDNEISVANYDCSGIVNRDDQIAGVDCTTNRSVYSTKIAIDNVINPITEFILNLPKALFEFAG